MVKKRFTKLQKEFRKTLATGITAAFGIIVALTWKDVLTSYLGELSKMSLLQG